VRHWLGELKNAVAGGDAQTAGQTLMEIVGADCADLVAVANEEPDAESLIENTVEQQG
jgi:hypothetical protein